MALQGNLKELRLGDVLQTVISSGSTGLLRVHGPGQRSLLHISPEGLRLIEPEVIDERLVVEGFLRRGLISEKAARQALSSEGASLDALVAAGTLDPSKVDLVLREASEEAVLEMFGWEEGSFRFDDGAEVERSLGPVARVVLELGALLLHAAQRIDERKSIHERIGPSAVLLIAVEHQAEVAAGLDSPAPEVFACLDGQRLLDEIALQEGLHRFDVVKTGAALVDAGAARIPTPEELSVLAQAREAAGDVRSALALARQWQTVRPLEPEPCLEAAAIAARANRYEDEAESLKAAGRVNLKIQRADDARAVFQKLLVKRPGDTDALSGLRQCAKLLGDAAAYSTTTRSLAEQALEAGDATHAASILKELLVDFPEDVSARLLRTKALARLGDRAQAAEELRRLAELLPTPCRKRSDREAAEYVRDTIPHLLPDQTDLLKAFSAKLGDRGRPRRRVAILAAFLLACSGAGIVLWPKGAPALWTKAQTAALAGDSSTALVLIEELIEKYPDADELPAAAALKAKLMGATHVAAPRLNEGGSKAVLDLAGGCAKALGTFPDTASLAAIDALCAALRTSDGSTVHARRAVTEAVRGPLAESVKALRHAAHERRDTLDATPDLATKPPADIGTFRALVEKAEMALDPAWGQAAEKGATAARKLASFLLEDSLLPGFAEDLRSLEGDVKAAERAVASRPGDVHRARVEYQRARLNTAYERARIDAARNLAHGDLDGAEACYKALDDLLAEIRTVSVLEPLRDYADRRGIAEFSRARSEMLGAIRRGLAAAKAAEDAGNLEGAAVTYASLVNQFPTVRFDEVFTIPLRIETVPPGAKVFVNRKEVGVSPIVVRYGFGTQCVVSVQAPGYDAASLVLKTSEEKPESVARLNLSPAVRWARALSGVVESEPLGIDGDVVICTRSGRVERLSKGTGDVVWSTDLRNLEGTRSKPTAERGLLYVPMMDGTVARLSLADGTVKAPLQLRSRPVGDAASYAGRVAIALESTVAIFAEGDTPTYVTLDASVSTGVLASHGAFWVGDVRGGVTRIDPSGGTKAYSTGAKEPVVGLASGKDLVYALTGDGVLVALDGAGTTPARWRRADIGDAVGRPAESSDVVAVADHTGHVSMFSITDGTPKGRKDLGAATRDGLRSILGRLAATLLDGRLWMYDPARDAVLVDTKLDGTARITLAPTGDGSVVAPASGNGIVSFPVPK